VAGQPVALSGFLGGSGPGNGAAVEKDVIKPSVFEKFSGDTYVSECLFHRATLDVVGSLSICLTLSN